MITNKGDLEVLERAFQILVDNDYTFLATILAQIIVRSKEAQADK